MADFTPINTQEELDRVIAARIQRERETVTKQFQAQIAEQQEKMTGLDGQIAELNKQLEAGKENAAKITELEAKVKGYETSSVKMRIARETGLPYELAERLTGEDEKAIRADAEGLRKTIGAIRTTAPLANTEQGVKNAKDMAYAKLLKELKGDET